MDFPCAVAFQEKGIIIGRRNYLVKILLVFFSLAINAIVSLEINRGNAAYADKVSAIKIK